MSPRAHGGRESEFWIEDSGNTIRDLSADVNNVDAPTNTDTAEVTGFGGTRKSFIAGQIDTPVTVAASFETAANRSHTVLSGLIGGTTGYLMKYFPKGSASGLPLLSGSVLLSGYQVTSPLADKVGVSATLVPADATGIVWSTV